MTFLFFLFVVVMALNIQYDDGDFFYFMVLHNTTLSV
jgi:hypothetical protein